MRRERLLGFSLTVSKNQRLHLLDSCVYFIGILENLLYVNNIELVLNTMLLFCSRIKKNGIDTEFNQGCKM